MALTCRLSCLHTRTYADAEAIDAQVAQPLHHHVVYVQVQCSSQ